MTSTGSKTPSPTPISVATSQTWDNDGAGEWSTFAVSVGTPAQVARVIVSTAGDGTWVVIAAGCPLNYGSSCPSNRGAIFNIDASTSWANISIDTLGLEMNLGYGGSGQFGYDTVTLGYPNSGGITLQSQVVAGLATPDFWLGQFGLDPAPNNFTNLNDPIPSFLSTLRNQSVIPSTSWTYTAGAAYRPNKVQGSLVLGGYDASRFGSSNQTFDFYNDNSRRFLANLQTISYVPAGVSTVTTPTILASTPLSMYIDSTIPFIYLPIDICAKFEEAFGLVWNQTYALYTINETVHTTLLNTNPSIKFSLANAVGQTLDIVLPYAAFDLTATFPILPSGTNATKYFPLKRADNDTQYTLGRVFLQETVLIADYDRSQFTLAPCVWPATFTEKLVAINPPGNSTAVTKGPSGAPLAAIVGGVVGGIILIAILALAYFWFVYRSKCKRRSENAEVVNIVNEPTPVSPITETAAGSPTSDTASPVWSPHSPQVSPAGAEKWRQTLSSEIAGTPIASGHEMEAGYPIFEMAAREPVGSELHSPLSGTHRETRPQVAESRESFEMIPVTSVQKGDALGSHPT